MFVDFKYDSYVSLSGALPWSHLDIVKTASHIMF